MIGRQIEFEKSIFMLAKHFIIIYHVMCVIIGIIKLRFRAVSMGIVCGMGGVRGAICEIWLWRLPRLDGGWKVIAMKR